MSSNPSHSERQTLRLTGADPAHLQQAAAILRNGGLVAMPTETVYGLAASALDPTAVESIFTAKQRPHWDPLIVHITGASMLPRITAAITSEAHQLIEAFWPGPLTLLLPRSSSLPSSVTAGRELVGVRAPNHLIAQALIAAADLPLAAPSANRFGHISPSTAQHVLYDLDTRIDAVLDGGPCTIGLESTVYDPQARILYRQGGVSQQQIEAAIGGPITVYSPTPQQEEPESLPSPGVGIRHYAPRARLILVQTESELNQPHDPSTTAVIRPTNWPAPSHEEHTIPWANWTDTAALAATLYSTLRQADTDGITTILCPIPTQGPLTEAIRDRLQKAAKDS